MTAWRLLAADAVDAAAGLAFDEAMLGAYSRDAADVPPTLRLYTYRSHCALIGRYQHLEAEVDLEACRRTGTEFNRRPTGGGAIVMGSGQLGVAVATRAPTEQTPRQMLERFSQCIIAGLRRVGIQARFRGKNDLEAGGRKIAGLGLYLDGRGGLLFHSSILADLDIAFMLEVLQIPAAKLGAPGIEAVRDRITTVTRETGEAWDGASLREEIAAGFSTALGVEVDPGQPLCHEIQAAEHLLEERYCSVQWLHQVSPRPDTTASATAKTPLGLVRVYLALQADTVKSVLFTGDFNTVPEPLIALEESLRWKRLERSVIEEAVGKSFSSYPDLGGAGQIVDALLEAGERVTGRALAAPQRHGSCYFPEVQQPQ